MSAVDHEAFSEEADDVEDRKSVTNVSDIVLVYMYPERLHTAAYPSLPVGVREVQLT